MDPNKLELIENDSKIVAVGFGITLFALPPLRDHAEAVLSVYNDFIDMVGASSFHFYATETMSKHRKVTKTSLEMLPTWFAKGSPRRDMIGLELKDGNTYDEAPNTLFKVFSEEYVPEDEDPIEEPAMLRLVVPANWVIDNLAELKNFFVDISQRLPFRFGTAGFAFICTQYEQETSQGYAWARGMRHRGLDIYADESDRYTTGFDGIKGVNWLTMIDSDYVAELGGTSKIGKGLPQGVKIAKLANGIVLQAGAKPELGDTNRRRDLPEYAAVYKRLQPLTERAFEHIDDLILDDDEEGDKTERWLRRFEA
jgi:hypothetical protein